ncbi:hypothetical protein BDK51DRAFT_39829 [Blyttiomyces helicus]|uniref:Uncharacterized protein n=1 Tax=Blyttiomyces helicus TaxID=388810 RepID=A0A4P9W0V6_9FUNG|nr:hypothetical protein BDK51DRAFT_39829 [Blyttiomyces helicus]|eukprot:RKO84965.1 hypothetical protein BDK51DRAFT_39829 [Blyttiomyces helicus]
MTTCKKDKRPLQPSPKSYPAVTLTALAPECVLIVMMVAPVGVTDDVEVAMVEAFANGQLMIARTQLLVASAFFPAHFLVRPRLLRAIGRRDPEKVQG